MTNKIEEFLNEKRKLEGLLRREFDSINQDILNDLVVANEYYISEKLSYVYFLKNKDTGLTKIGYTGDLITRIKSIVTTIKSQIGIEHSFELTMLIPILSKHASQVEKYFHKEYKSKRKFGEWFDLNDEDCLLSFIDAYQYIDDTMIITDNCFEESKYIPKVFSINNDDFLYAFNIKPISSWYKPTNPYVMMYKTCKDNQIGFRAKKLIYDEYKIKPIIDGFFIDNDDETYDISQIKSMKLNKEEISAINSWLIKQQ